MEDLCNISNRRSNNKIFKTLGRHEEQVELVETYSKIQGFWRESDSEITYTDVIELDLSEIEPCLSGPKRPQDRIKLKDVASVVKSEIGDEPSSLDQISGGSVLIAAITSCTNTSNPTVMVAAGLVAKKANALGLKSKEWLKPVWHQDQRLSPSTLKNRDYCLN
ncbi:MAG: hypothetical protein Ct9H90mP13_04120 [Pseudomonadota bacterium]|nr:MAG: hypothetical protein Ct9H90mP13_04120 [Pseudomonadota bacterium]